MEGQIVPERADVASRFLKVPRTAVLVIHGMGQQRPYETLDCMARNLAAYLRSKCRSDVTLTPKKSDHGDWVEVYIQLDAARGCGAGERRGVDIYEYYWAPCTQDKISYRQTLSWLIRTDLSPIRHLATNLLLEADASDPRLLAESPAKIFLRELLRIVLLYLPALLLSVWMLTWIPTASQLTGFLTSAAGILRGPAGFAKAIFFGLVALTAIMVTLAAFLPADRSRLRLGAIDSNAGTVWRLSAALAAGIFAALSLLVAMFARFSVLDVARALCAASTAKLFLVAGLAAGLRLFLRDYLGDVAVYVNADVLSKNYAARKDILDGSTLALMRLLKARFQPENATERPRYDAVIVAGHSLGSVIAYDSINELLNRCSAGPDPLDPQSEKKKITKEDLDRLTGLVTFGSPLDKVYYFFRDWAKPDQTIRAQVLSYLHSFRKVPSRRDYRPDKFTPYSAVELASLKWLNAWSIMDIVSGKLRFYKVDIRKEFPYRLPVIAHMAYWRDPKFYEFVANELLLT